MMMQLHVHFVSCSHSIVVVAGASKAEWIATPYSPRRVGTTAASPCGHVFCGGCGLEWIRSNVSGVVDALQTLFWQNLSNAVLVR